MFLAWKTLKKLNTKLNHAEQANLIKSNGEKSDSLNIFKAC